MKFSKYLTVCGIALMVAALGADLQAQTMKQSKAKVRNVRGEVRYKANAAADWAPLKVNTALNPGAIVETGSKSSVDLFLTDIGSVVRITESTQMGIDKLGYSKEGDETVVDTELNLKAGTILGNVKKLAATSRYDVKIPNGVCGIRGTEFRVSVSGIVSVISGTVRVTYQPPGGGAPIVRDVGAGQTFYPPVAGGEPTVSSIPPTDPVWIDITKVPQTGGTFEVQGGGAVTVTPIEPTTKPPSQHPNGEPDSPPANNN